MKKIFVYCIVLVVVVFSACNQENPITDNEESCVNMLYFNSEKEMFAKLKNVIEMSGEERLQWETKNGFKSFGIAAKDFYDSFDPEQFQSLEELKEFVEKNNKYLRLIEENGENTLETNLSENPFRYLVNTDRLIQVGENVYKAFEEKLIQVDEKYADVEKNMEMNEILNISNGNVIELKNNFLKSTQYNCGTNFPDLSLKSTDEKYKLNLSLRCYFHKASELAPMDFFAYMLIESYKRSFTGLWYYKYKNTISYNMNFRIEWTHTNSQLISVRCIDSENGKDEKEIEKTWYPGSYPAYVLLYDPEVHFQSIDCWTTIPQLTLPVSLMCNTPVPE